MRALTMSTTASPETVCPFLAANRQRAAMTVIVVMEEAVSADRAKNAQWTLTAAVLVLVITANVAIPVLMQRTARATHRGICANTDFVVCPPSPFHPLTLSIHNLLCTLSDLQCVREVSADQFQIGCIPHSNLSIETVLIYFQCIDSL